MNKTDILDVTARKLAPFMFLFGLYLFAHGHLSPGGGFQAGVVIASGTILLALGRKKPGTQSGELLKRLSTTETATYVLLILVGAVGMVSGVGFLGNFLDPTHARVGVPRTSFMILLNLLIGAKVGAGISLVSLYLFQERQP